MEYTFFYPDDRPHLLRRFSATATVSVMASAIVADIERNPAQSDSATSNHSAADCASGENELSVIATTGTPCSANTLA